MRNNLKFLLLFPGLIVLDQISKFLVLRYFAGIYSVNPDAGFSISFGTVDTSLITISALLLFVLLLYFLDKKALKTVGFVLILSGTLSNLLDRLIHAGVIDFIDFKIWPSFNLADSFIVIGVALLILRELKFKEIKP